MLGKFCISDGGVECSHVNSECKGNNRWSLFPIYFLNNLCGYDEFNFQEKTKNIEQCVINAIYFSTVLAHSRFVAILEWAEIIRNIQLFVIIFNENKLPTMNI